MNRVLYILNNNHQNYLLMEDDKIKYFDFNTDLLGTIRKYLESIIKFNTLSIKRIKNIIYKNTKYTVVFVSINVLIDILNTDCFKNFSLIDISKLSYNDYFILNNTVPYQLKSNVFSEKPIPIPDVNNTLKITFVSILFALLSTIFFIGNSNINYIGISLPILVTLFVIYNLFFITPKHIFNLTACYFLFVSIVLSFTFAIYTNPLLRAINIFLIPLSLTTGLLLINYRSLNINSYDLKNIILPNITLGIFYNSQLELISKSIKATKVNEIIKRNTKSLSILKGILISIPILLVLILLLGSADKIFFNVFQDTLNYLCSPLYSFNINVLLLKLFLFCLLFIIIYFVLSSSKYISYTEKIKKSKFIDKNIANTVLILINILYLLFTFIQTKYLYFKKDFYSFTAEEYSEYARNGFFQLLFVVLINIAIIIYLNIKVSKNNLTSILTTTTTVISINMSIASLYKMGLYINNFGFTRLRFLTSIFIIYILILLFLLLLSLWKKINFIKHIIIIGSILYLLINFCNIDKIITKYNLSLNSRDVDIHYLINLSFDNYDEIIEAYKNGIIDNSQLKYYLRNKKSDFKWFEYNYHNKKTM